MKIKKHRLDPLSAPDYSESPVFNPQKAVREYGLTATETNGQWKNSGLLQGPIAYTVASDSYRYLDGRISTSLDGPAMKYDPGVNSIYGFHSHPLHTTYNGPRPPSIHDVLIYYGEVGRAEAGKITEARKGDGIFDGYSQTFYWATASNPLGDKYTFKEARKIFGRSIRGQADVS